MLHTCIMLVGERPADNLSVQRVLKQANLASHVLVHTSTISALEYLQSVTQLDTDSALPALVFVNVDMPLMNGFQFIESCSKRLPDLVKRIRFVLISDAYELTEDRLSKTYPVVLGYLPKPFTAEQCLELQEVVLV